MRLYPPMGSAFAALLLLLVSGSHAGSGSEQPHVSASSARDAGRYLVVIAGCNDCHTPGWDEAGGSAPVSRWLVGSDVGFRGPWGTTYPTNLRTLVSGMSRAKWVAFARHLKARPPMPSWALNRMSDSDLIALYTFVKGLGPAGKPAPGYVPPNQEPKTPFIPFVPQSSKT